MNVVAPDKREPKSARYKHLLWLVGLGVVCLVVWLVGWRQIRDAFLNADPVLLILMAFLDAKLRRGVEIVLRYSRFEEKIRDADLIITGEGRVDATSAQGKTSSGIAQAAKAAGVPVVVLAGSVGEESDELFKMGIKAILPICTGPMTLETAMAAAPGLLEAAAARVMRFVKV